MMKNLDVVALGGNAILPVGKPGTIGEQVAITRTAMLEIEQLIARGRHVVLTHGNGPIVGNIVMRNQAIKEDIPPMPLDVC
ncbi:MAG: carbamate kinase, partial [bacterium]